MNAQIEIHIIPLKSQGQTI